MKHLVAILVAAIVCAVASTASAATGTTQTQNYADGTHATLTITPDAATTTTTKSNILTSTSYPCGNYGYNMYISWYNVFGWTMWTYHSHFGVHVCNNSVQYLVSLYDEPMNTFPGWAWCGSIVRSWVNYGYEAQSYTKGCFDVTDKLIVVKYPWARITIGGNGGLWANSWGIG